MTERLKFNANDQGEIATTAVELFCEVENSLPRIPWFSDSGQQEAFRKIVQLITDKADGLDADNESKKAVIFWALAILYDSIRSFRRATASVKNRSVPGTSPVASSFVSWVGSNTHPAEIVAASLDAWRKNNHVRQA